MTRFEAIPERSQIWVTGTSSVHGISASATGLEGFIDLAISAGKPDPDSEITGRMEIEVDRLRSDNPLVDRETRRQIKAREFPTLCGWLTEVAHVAGNQLEASGVISFRGQEHQVQGTLNLEVDQEGLVIEGSQQFDVRDWGLQPPKLLLLKVHPEVDVRIRLEMQPAPG